VTTPLRLAETHLAGSTRIDGAYICRNCGHVYHLTPGLDPSAFCNDCKDAALDLLAKGFLHLHEKLKRIRHKSVRARRCS